MLGETRSVTPLASGTQHGQSGFPWGLVILGIAAIAVIAFIMRAMARPNPVPAPYSGNPGGNYPGSYPPAGTPGGYGAAPSAPGMGSGIVSGLATGAALGAGMVAGEALAHHFIDGNRGEANQGQTFANADNARPYDMGGNDFGIADNSSWDDSSVTADNSGGGDDWT